MVRVHTATPLMRLVMGFWGFKTLAAAVELGLFTRLAGGRTLTLKQLAAELGLADRPATALLTACTALGLLERTDEGYANSPLAEEFLVAGARYDFSGYVRNADRRGYPLWHRLVEALRTDQPVGWDPEAQASLFDTADPQVLDMFWEAMQAASSSTGRVLAAAHDFGAYRRLLDVGGGSGASAIELCGRYPQLRATVFELPHVCEIATDKVAAAGMSDRIDTTAGDFLTQPTLPAGYDLILLSSIMHCWDEATNQALIAKCHAALPRGGALVIAELLLNDDFTGPMEPALMGMNMVVNTRGRNYAESEYFSWLADAGFADVGVVRFDAPHANGAVIARKP